MNNQFDYKLFGLESRDIRVYEAMLAQPEALSIRALADIVHMNRGTTFEIIKKLVRVGLVASHYKLSRKYYMAKSPVFLEKFAQDRQRTMTDEMQRVREYVGGLERIQAQESGGMFSILYEGEDEIALLLHDVLQTVSEQLDKTYRVISSAQISNHLYPKFANFTRQRIKLGITARVIGVGGKSTNPAELSERKWLSNEQTPECYIMIYGDKVAQISLTSQHNVHGAVAENKGVVELYRLLFDKLWEKL